jgi:hypothetical protein
MILAEPTERPDAGAPAQLEWPQKQRPSVGRRAHHDDRLAAFGAQHVTLPGFGPIEGLHRGAGRARLQLLPQSFEAVDVAGYAEPDLAEARRHSDCGTSRSSVVRPRPRCGTGQSNPYAATKPQAALPADFRWQSFRKEQLSNLGTWIKTMPEQG